ncbi:hypothetical protein [Paenibacillus sp. MBLB4367]
MVDINKLELEIDSLVRTIEEIGESVSRVSVSAETLDETTKAL